MEIQDKRGQVGLQLYTCTTPSSQCRFNEMLLSGGIEKGLQCAGGIGHDTDWAWTVDCIMYHMLIPELRFKDLISYFNHL